MNIRRTLVGLAALATASASALAQSAAFDYGEAWRVRTKDARYMYVSGLEGALGSIYSALANLSGRPDAPGYAEVARVLTKSQHKTVGELVKRAVDDYKIYPFSAESVADLVTQLYVDRANQFIRWSDMAHIAAMKLRGDEEEKIQDEIRLARSWAAIAAKPH